MEDDDRAANRSNFKRDRGNDRKDEGNGKKNKRDDIDEGKQNNGEAFKWVNTVFMKPIHKIMFEIQASHFLNGPDKWVEIQVKGIPNSGAFTIRIMVVGPKTART